MRPGAMIAQDAPGRILTVGPHPHDRRAAVEAVHCRLPGTARASTLGGGAAPEA